MQTMTLSLFFQLTGEKRPSSDMMKPKPKPQKKKKKKDPNEPQKPVSAYALFFRDTQAAIKGQNPNATFGDVSKIVASMWDSLGEEQKQVSLTSRCQERARCLLFHSSGDWTEFTVLFKHIGFVADVFPLCWKH